MKNSETSSLLEELIARVDFDVKGIISIDEKNISKSKNSSIFKTSKSASEKGRRIPLNMRPSKGKDL